MIRNGIIIGSTLVSAIIASFWLWSYVGEYEFRNLLGSEVSIRGWLIGDSNKIGDLHERSPDGHRLVYGKQGEFGAILYPRALGIENFAEFELSFESIGFSILGYKDYCTIRIPFWIAFIITFSFPLLAFVRGPFRRWSRRRSGRCATCGYDLRGTDSATCSECGTPIEPVA